MTAQSIGMSISRTCCSNTRVKIQWIWPQTNKYSLQVFSVINKDFFLLYFSDYWNGFPQPRPDNSSVFFETLENTVRGWWYSEGELKRIKGPVLRNLYIKLYNIFIYTVHPPICGFFISKKSVHKSGFVHKSGESPQIESVGDFIHTM